MTFKPLARPAVVQPSDPTIRHIPLTQGYIAVVDASDYDRVNAYVWYVRKCPGRRYATTGPGKIQTGMHQLVLGISRGTDIYVDHIDGDGLNNRSSNLRLATNAQNQHNVGLNCRNTSGYKGVSYRKKEGKWIAQIRIDRKKRHLGCFLSPENAAIAYNIAALEYQGEFAWLNK